MEQFAIGTAVADRLLQHCRCDPVGRALHHSVAVWTADAPAEQMGLFDTEMIQERDVIGGIGVPSVVAGYGGVRLARVALIHGDDLEVRRQRFDGIPLGTAPKWNGGSHAARREKQDRESVAVDFVVKADLAVFESSHGPLSQASEQTGA